MSPVLAKRLLVYPSPLQTFYSSFLPQTPGLLTLQCTGMERSVTVPAGSSGSRCTPSPALPRAAFARLGLPGPRRVTWGLFCTKLGFFNCGISDPEAAELG